jgi:hypothetical protein
MNTGQDLFNLVAVKFNLTPDELRAMAKKMMPILDLPFLLAVLMVAQMLDAGGAEKWLESFQPDSIMVTDHKEAILKAFSEG